MVHRSKLDKSLGKWAHVWNKKSNHNLVYGMEGGAKSEGTIPYNPHQKQPHVFCQR